MGGVVSIRAIDLRQAPGARSEEGPSPVDPRRRLEQIAAEQGKSLAMLSAVIGRNAAYLQQFVRRGSPRRLPEEERRHLAIYLNIDERELGAREPWSPPGL
jgi:hypothetical protein